MWRTSSRSWAARATTRSFWPRRWSAGTVDLAGGTDTLSLSSAGPNSINVANVESLLGGSGNDTIVLAAAVSSATIDLGAGTDTLSLANGVNSITVANVESLLGGNANDTVVLTTALVGGTIDLSGGTDTLSLANGVNSINVANVESLLGGSGGDTIVLTTSLVGGNDRPGCRLGYAGPCRAPAPTASMWRMSNRCWVGAAPTRSF